MSMASRHVSVVERFAGCVGALSFADLGGHELIITRSRELIARAGTVDETIPSMTLTLPDGTRARDVFDVLVKDKEELTLLLILAALEWVAQNGPSEAPVAAGRRNLKRLARAICKRTEMGG